jgi:hypothetical protein
MSQFWNELPCVEQWYKWGIVLVGDGKQTRFGFDVWVKDAPFKSRFPYLFWVIVNPFGSVRVIMIYLFTRAT